MAVAAGELYVVVVINYISGGFDIHDEVFISEESADKFRDSLDGVKSVGYVRKVNINYS